MSSVHPVIVLSAEFCTVCSLFLLVSVMMGDHIVLAYSNVGLVIALYVVSNVSFVFPQCVVVSDFRMFTVFLAFVTVFCMCCEKVNFGSNVSPSILGVVVVGSGVLFMCRFMGALYWAGSGVNSVAVVLVAFRVSWFCLVQLCICSR